MGNRWPAALKQSLPLYTDYELPDQWVETEMTAGAARRRPRFGATVGLLQPPSFSMIYSDYLVFEVLLPFYDDTLTNGLQSFRWRDPLPHLGDVVVRFRKVDKSARPKYRGFTPGSDDTRQWRVHFELEVLPNGHPGWIDLS